MQALVIDHAERHLPCLHLADAPRYGYRGLMVDVARFPHTLPTLQKLVEPRRYYKIRYLQLHLSDIEAFAFPSTAFPGLATPGRHLGLAQWRELEAFAERRQVVLVPELDVPGHAHPALRRLCPTRPRSPHPVINPVAENTFAVLDTLIRRDPGRSSCISSSTSAPTRSSSRVGKAAAGLRGFLREHGLTDIKDVYRHFIVRMRDLVQARGRRMIVWEGFAAAGAIAIPPDVIVQFFDVEYLQPEQAVARGHQVINSCWGPLYIVPSYATCPLEMVHGWHPGIFGGNALSLVPDALEGAPPFDACHDTPSSMPAPCRAGRIPSPRRCRWKPPPSWGACCARGR